MYTTERAYLVNQGRVGRSHKGSPDDRLATDDLHNFLLCQRGKLKRGDKIAHR